MVKDLVILGAGGFAKEVAWLIEEINEQKKSWNLLGFIDKDDSKIGNLIGNHPVIMIEDELIQYDKEIYCVIGIGSPHIMKKVSGILQSNNYIKYPNLLHPNLIWDRKNVHLGYGNVICAGNILTTNIRIGNFNILNLSSTYGHDTIIGDFNVINPGVSVSGCVNIGDSCLIGTRAVILENVEIGNSVIVGGGAVVTKNVPESITVVGIPAKPLNK